jgi:biopolymer transport protein ExbD
MTAMIDVIFLLLTFFVLTARFRTPEEFLPIHLPTADAAVQKFGIIEPLEIDISADQAGCVVRIGQLETVRIEAGRGAEGLAAFANELTNILSRQKRTTGDPIEIRCAGEIKWDHLVKIYNVLQAMGINDITFRMTE